jgi:hypothetical protein
MDHREYERLEADRLGMSLCLMGAFFIFVNKLTVCSQSEQQLLVSEKE